MPKELEGREARAADTGHAVRIPERTAGQEVRKFPKTPGGPLACAGSAGPTGWFLRIAGINLPAWPDDLCQPGSALKKANIRPATRVRGTDHGAAGQ